MKVNFFCLVLLSVWLSGCSTYSKKECLDMNVALESEKLTQNGLSESDVIKYFDKECRIENDVALDANQIKLGHKNGLKKLCTPEGMARLGQAGLKYNFSCPEVKTDSLSEYFKNYTLKLENEIENLRNQVLDLERENDRLRDEVSDLKSKQNQ